MRYTQTCRLGSENLKPSAALPVSDTPLSRQTRIRRRSKPERVTLGPAFLLIIEVESATDYSSRFRPRRLLRIWPIRDIPDKTVKPDTENTRPIQVKMLRPDRHRFRTRHELRKRQKSRKFRISPSRCVSHSRQFPRLPQPAARRSPKQPEGPGIDGRQAVTPHTRAHGQCSRSGRRGGRWHQLSRLNLNWSPPGERPFPGESRHRATSRHGRQ